MLQDNKNAPPSILFSICACLLAATATTSLYADDVTANEVKTNETKVGRCAVVVGIRSYDPDQLQPLPNAETEATELFELLQRAGYADSNSLLLTNTAGSQNSRQIPSRANILQQIEKASSKLTASDTLILAFQGHGVQTKDGKYYLCPLDADLENIASLIPIEQIYEIVGRCSAEHKLVLLDAMQSDPLASEFAASSGADFRAVLPNLPAPPTNTAVFLSCSEGESTATANTTVNKKAAQTTSFFGSIGQAIRGEAAGTDGSVTLPDMERFVKKQFAINADSIKSHPLLQNNTAGLFPIVSSSLATDEMDKIQEYIREDRYTEALVIVEKRLSTHPKDALAQAQKSRLISYEAEQFRNLSRMKEAMVAAELAVQGAPSESLPYIARANVYRINKQYEKAFADASTAVQCDPNNVMAHVIRAFAFHHLHDLENMAREAKLGMEIDPANPEARATYAAYLFAKGKIDEGIKELDRAIAVCPKMAALHFLKGYAMDKKGKFQEAAYQYGLAIKINDQIPGYFCRRAVSHANYGNSSEAMADIAAAEKLLPTYDDIASARSMVIQKQQGYGKAGKAIAEGLKANPNSADLWQGQGFDFYNRGQYAQAIESFNKALEINPGYGLAHLGIGMACKRMNKLDEAIVHLNRATRHEPNLARAYYEKSEVYVMQGQSSAAVAELEKAIEYAPSDEFYAQRRQILISTSR